VGLSKEKGLCYHLWELFKQTICSLLQNSSTCFHERKKEKKKHVFCHLPLQHYEVTRNISQRTEDFAAGSCVNALNPFTA
jgi:hypothetical protein